MTESRPGGEPSITPGMKLRLAKSRRYPAGKARRKQVTCPACGTRAVPVVSFVVPGASCCRRCGTNLDVNVKVDP